MRQIDFTNTQVASSETARNINRGVGAGIFSNPGARSIWLGARLTF
jgi:hypothetical protein